MPPLISWQDFLDEDQVHLVEQRAAERMAMVIWAPGTGVAMFDRECSAATWELFPREAAEHALAEAELARLGFLWQCWHPR
jgi:hypothetical protein